MQAWRRDRALPDAIFIVARNDYPELYIDLAKADALRLYTHIAIANVADSVDKTSASCKGSSVIVPHRTKMEIDGATIAATGQFFRGVTVFPLLLSVPRARSRGKPHDGHFAVPRSAQRQ